MMGTAAALELYDTSICHFLPAAEPSFISLCVGTKLRCAILERNATGTSVSLHTGVIQGQERTAACLQEQPAGVSTDALDQACVLCVSYVPSCIACMALQTERPCCATSATQVVYVAHTHCMHCVPAGSMKVLWLGCYGVAAYTTMQHQAGAPSFDVSEASCTCTYYYCPTTCTTCKCLQYASSTAFSSAAVAGDAVRKT
jgi:hypothetical protein